MGSNLRSQVGSPAKSFRRSRVQQQRMGVDGVKKCGNSKNNVKITNSFQITPSG